VFEKSRICFAFILNHIANFNSQPGVPKDWSKEERFMARDFVDEFTFKPLNHPVYIKLKDGKKMVVSN
jgi:hypothetical protein